METTNPLIDINSEIEELISSNPWDFELPDSLDNILALLLNLRRTIVQVIAARLKAVPPRAVSELEWAKLAAFLSILHNLKILDPKMKSEKKLDLGLDAIINPAHKFPIKYQRIARHLFENFEAKRWGAAEEEPDITPVTNTGTITSASAGQFSTSVRKRKSDTTDEAIDLPDDSDPIFGNGGIMNNILRYKNSTGTVYKINPTFTQRNAKIFGHNGLLVGQCWPLQIALIRDGAHGSRMGGISGSQDDGAYSIVVSGAYDDLDKDYGDVIYYSGSNSHENKSAEPITSNGTKALQRSATTRRAVRVFRSHSAKWASAPRGGLRYDGLYTIVSMSVEKNGLGGGYKRFRLVRNQGQDAIKISEPSPALISLFNRVQHGYTRTKSRKVAYNSSHLTSLGPSSGAGLSISSAAVNSSTASGSASGSASAGASNSATSS